MGFPGSLFESTHHFPRDRNGMAQPRYTTLITSTVKCCFNVVASKASARRG